MAGIWPFGTGAVRPGAGRHLFMPQRPYMPLGTLRRVVTYPLNEADVSDDAVVAALEDAGLGHLAGELATVDTWERRLSGGEQQKLAIARALLVQPDWLFLDEATSNLDPESEARVYALLRERLPGTTFVSVAHGRDVVRFHSRVLRIENGEARLDVPGMSLEAL